MESNEFDMIPQVFMASVFQRWWKSEAYIPETSKGCYTILEDKKQFITWHAIFGKEDNEFFSIDDLFLKTPSGGRHSLITETSRPGIERRFLKDNSSTGFPNNADYLNRLAASQEQVGRSSHEWRANPSQKRGCRGGMTYIPR